MENLINKIKNNATSKKASQLSIIEFTNFGIRTHLTQKGKDNKKSIYFFLSARCENSKTDKPVLVFDSLKMDICLNHLSNEKIESLGNEVANLLLAKKSFDYSELVKKHSK